MIYYSIKLNTSQGNLTGAFLKRSTLPTGERAFLKVKKFNKIKNSRGTISTDTFF